jgi:hypothetical protein
VLEGLTGCSHGVYGHGPTVSPWARCAGTAGAATVIVTLLPDLPATWQIVTLPY